MKTRIHPPVSHWPQHVLPLAAVSVLMVGPVAGAATTNFTYKAELSAKFGYDSNVYLQDVEPDLVKYPKAVRPFQDSFVTSVTPRVAFDYQPGAGFKVGFAYAPEIAFYTSEPSEDYTAHRFAVNLGGKTRKVTWECPNSVTYIDGGREGLTFGGPGGAPSIGGIPIRDRKASVVTRDMIRTIHNWGDWLFRPTASAYLHDFMTVKKNPADPAHPENAGYQNYVDRNDVNGGIDVGYKLPHETYLVLGARVGRQEERPLPWSPYEYSNHYVRLLPGLEGKPWPWLKLALSAGPDIRDFDKHTPPGFQDHNTVIYVDSSVVITPDHADAVILTFKRYEQPAFGAPSMYEDITYDLLWKHTFDPKLTVSTGFRAYAGEWMPPVQRDDWIYTGSASISYAWNRHLSTELAYSYDFTESLVPNTSGREFTRHLTWMTIRYAF